jgi:hypothetical protein
MEKRLMFRLIRVPPILDKFVHTLQPHVHWNHMAYIRLLVVVPTFAWAGATWPASAGIWRPSITHTRFNNCFVVARRAPEAALRQKAQEGVMARHPGTGETRSLVIDDSKTAKWGPYRDAGATMKDPVTEGSIHGHQ